jgi:peptidyl-Asp metalloendopeptidase
MGQTWKISLAAATLALVCSCSNDEVGGPVGKASAAAANSRRTADASGADIAITAPHGARATNDADLISYGPAHDVREEAGQTWYPVQLREASVVAAQGEGEIRLSLPDGGVTRLRYERQVRHEEGVWTWIGRSTEGLGEAVLTFGRHSVFGTIPQRGRPPLRITTRDLRTWIVQGSVAGARPSASPDFKVPSALAAATGTTAGLTSTSLAPAYTSTEKQTVDLVLGYTTGFKNHWLSPYMCQAVGAAYCEENRRDNTLARLNFLVDIANQAYLNSGVAAQVRVVRMQEVAYTDSNTNEDALEALTGSDGTTTSAPAAAFAGLRAARDQYGGDLVVLVRQFQTPENDGCGIAWLNGGGNVPITVADAFYGYSIVGDGTDADTDGVSYYCLDATLAHEMGHNMGAQHDAVTAGSSPGTFAYSYGYKASWFYTIMAYGDEGQTAYNVFSNPRTNYCGGQACGTALADNARTLSQVMPTIAAFRNAVIAPPRAQLVQFDANANGKSDLFFTSIGGMSVWYMSGATRTAFASYLPYSSWLERDRLVDVGDFAGDGRGDLLYVDSTNHMSYLGSTGNGFEGSTIPDSAPLDWVHLAMVDINGDGKRAEVILRNRFTGAGAVWFYVVNPYPSRVAYSGFSVPASYAYVGSGDLDGDRRSDVVWTDVAGRILVSRGNGSGLAAPAQLPLTYDNRYSLVAVADANADGKADLVFWRAATRQVVVWLMQGTTRSSYFTSIVPAGYWLAGRGDFDGDKRGDLVWTNPSRQIMFAFSTGTGFNYSVLPYTVAPGWTVMGTH